MAVGGESQGQSLSNVECFMMGIWKCSIPFENGTGKDFSDVAVIPTMKQCRFYGAVASQNYKMYVVGGQDCGKYKNSIPSIVSMFSYNQTFAFVSITAILGFPLNIVERYDILQNRWETLSPLPVS